VKQQARTEWIVLILLVASGVSLRLLFQDLPNFAPVAALALFSGYYFLRRWMAILVPLLVMTLSDYFIGGYHLGLMVLIYAMLALPVAARGILRRVFRMERGRLSSTVAAVAGLVACGVGSSLLFFLVSNAGHWLFFDMYDHTISGLLLCYLRALEFFRFTLAGDLCFATALFSGYALAMNLGYLHQEKPRPVLDV